jgi:hypothetical protein
MRIIEKLKSWFLPAFLRNFDHKLLLNNPVLWTSRAHLVSWLGLLSLAILALIFFTIPNDPRHESVVYLPTFFILIVAIVGIIIWLIYLLRFNVFKRFGTYTWKSMLGSFLLLFASLGWFVLLPFLPSAIETYRADQAYTSEELVLETERMNFLISELVYDSLSVDFTGDTLLVSDSLIQAENDKNTYVIENYLEESLNICTQQYLRKRIADYDGILSIGNGYYVLLTAPNYRFLNADKSKRYFPIKTLSNLAFYNLIHRNYNSDSLNNWRTEFEEFKTKYASDEDYYLNRTYYENDGSYYLEKLGVSSIEEGLGNISFRKYFWRGEAIEVFFRIWFYSVLGLSLLIFVFRHSTTKVFFLSFFVSVLLMMISGLLGAFLSLDEIGVYTLILLYILMFFIYTFSIFKSTRKSKIQGIALNLFTLLIGFLPLIIVLYYNEMISSRYINNPDYYNYYADFDVRIQVAEVAGILLLIILIPTLIFKAYRKWYALPDE